MLTHSRPNNTSRRGALLSVLFLAAGSAGAAAFVVPEFAVPGTVIIVK